MSRDPYLAEIHTFDTFASKRWTDGWTWTCLAGADNQLDDLVGRGHFTSHSRDRPGLTPDKATSMMLGKGLMVYLTSRDLRSAIVEDCSWHANAVRRLGPPIIAKMIQ